MSFSYSYIYRKEHTRCFDCFLLSPRLLMHDIMWHNVTQGSLCWSVTWFDDEVGKTAELCNVGKKNANCLVKWVSSGDRWNEKRMEFWHFWTFQFQLGEIVTFDIIWQKRLESHHSLQDNKAATLKRTLPTVHTATGASFGCSCCSCSCTIEVGLLQIDFIVLPHT